MAHGSDVGLVYGQFLDLASVRRESSYVGLLKVGGHPANWDFRRCLNLVIL